MRKSGRLLSAIILFLCMDSIPQKSTAQRSDELTYQVFYDQLSPFGKWLHDPVNGYVWVPKTEKNFRPYFTNGSWKMTEYGSTWVSQYSWGWAPFHYGRWLYDYLYGWIWIPGTEWGPSWVVWRSDGTNYGWTPLTPGYDVHNSFSPNYYVPSDWWVFVPARYLLNADFQKYAKTNTQITTPFVKNSRVLNGVYTKDNSNYISGPRAQDYGKSMNTRVPVYTLTNTAKPGKVTVSNEQIMLFKPSLTKAVNGKAPAPANSVAAEHPIGKFSAIGNGGTTVPKTAAKKKSTTVHKKKTK